MGGEPFAAERAKVRFAAIPEFLVLLVQNLEIETLNSGLELSRQKARFEVGAVRHA